MRSKPLLLLPVLSLLAGPSILRAESYGIVEGLDSLASWTLSRALEDLGIERAELGFDKLYAEDDTFRLGIVEDLLNDPLAVPVWQRTTLDRARYAVTDPGNLVEFLGEISEAEPPRTASIVRWPAVVFPVPVEDGRSVDPQAWADSLRSIVAGFCARIGGVENWIDRAFAHLTEGEIDTLLTLAPAFWGDPDHPGDRLRKGAIHFEVGATADTTMEISEDAVLDAAAKVDRASLIHAGEIFQMALIDLTGALAPLPLPGEGVPLDGVDGEVLAVEETPWGLFVIGGPGPNGYSAEALRRIAFLIEPGGDDVYRGRAASAVGRLLRPVSALVDASGNDLYEARSRAYTLGGALFGVASLIDLGGDDLYRAEDGSFGAGFFGVGLLYDGAGVDLFEGRNFCQGAGAVGIGALVCDSGPIPPPGAELQEDRAYDAGLIVVPGSGARPVRYDENDTYLCARQSQGFASTFGAGLLYDRTGNDTYRSGGYYLHAPLLPNDFQSLSQGFSIGFRPRAGGGIGLLIDEEGNDFYSAEVYAQGVSYWYSIGLLFDGGGNDRYAATQYAQGAGVHLSIGSLWDRGGDDHYVAKFGVTQGTAHDLSVGLLLDEGGNDYYVVSDGQGISITNSVALFIDSQGDDFYATPRSGQGSLTWARGFCGAGIFLDLEGTDRYAADAGGADGAVWSSDLYAIGIDLDRDVTLPDEVIPEPVLTAEDSLRTLEELFETASIWDVGSAREKVRRARKALIAKGIEAVDYVTAEKMTTDDGLEYRAIVSLAEAYPDSFAARVVPRLDDPDEKVVRNAIRLLGDLKRNDARPRLEEILHDRTREEHWTRILDALGGIGDADASPSVRPFLSDPLERRRLNAVSALASLKDTVSVSSLVDLLEDWELTVRASAAQALESFGAAAVEPLAERLADDLNQRRLVVRTIGRIAAPLADSTDAGSLRTRSLARRTLMAELDRAWESEDAPTRAAAVEALLRLGDKETVEFVRLRMTDEYDPLVRRTYEREAEGRAK